MSRSYLTLGAMMAVAVAAWTTAAVAQPIPVGPPPFSGKFLAPLGPPAGALQQGRTLPLLPMLPHLPGTPIFVGPPPPPYMEMVFLDFGLWPPVSPPIAGQVASPSAAEMCQEMTARHAASRAYLKVRLNLSSQQLAVWQEFEDAASDIDLEERGTCSKLAAKSEERTIIQRMDLAEEMLGRHLTQLRKVNAPLRKVIAMLTADQLRSLEQSMPFMPR